MERCCRKRKAGEIFNATDGFRNLGPVGMTVE